MDFIIRYVVFPWKSVLPYPKLVIIYQYISLYLGKGTLSTSWEQRSGKGKFMASALQCFPMRHNSSPVVCHSRFFNWQTETETGNERLMSNELGAKVGPLVFLFERSGIGMADWLWSSLPSKEELMIPSQAKEAKRWFGAWYRAATFWIHSYLEMTSGWVDLKHFLLVFLNFTHRELG
jgi:hypothetical protein